MTVSIYIFTGGFGTQAKTTAATGFSFGAPAATTASGFSFGGAPASSASTGFSFGGAPASTATTGFSFGGANTGTSAFAGGSAFPVRLICTNLPELKELSLNPVLNIQIRYSLYYFV